MLGFAPRPLLGTFVHAFVPLKLSNSEGEKCPCLLHGWLATFFFFFFAFRTQVFSFLPRWWGGRGGEKIGNRTTHSGSESARHLVVC